MQIKQEMLERLPEMGFEKITLATCNEVWYVKGFEKIYNLKIKSNDRIIRIDADFEEDVSIIQDNTILELKNKGFIEEEGCEYCNGKIYR